MDKDPLLVLQAHVASEKISNVYIQYQKFEKELNSLRETIRRGLIVGDVVRNLESNTIGIIRKTSKHGYSITPILETSFGGHYNVETNHNLCILQELSDQEYNLVKNGLLLSLLGPTTVIINHKKYGETSLDRFYVIHKKREYLKPIDVIDVISYKNKQKQDKFEITKRSIIDKYLKRYERKREDVETNDNSEI